MLTLVSGGSASGKSEFAESLIVQSHCGRRFYLATMIAFDEECHRRIARHRKMRAAKGFDTIEVPTNLEQIIFSKIYEKNERCALLECMSNLTANEIFSPEFQKIPIEHRGDIVSEKILNGVDRLINNCEDIVIVTNELFSDGICYDKETGEYLRVLAQINQSIAQKADRVFEVVAGIPILWKGEQ